MTSAPISFEGAPFTDPQRAWLGGFLQGALGLELPPVPAAPARTVFDRRNPFAAEVRAARRLTGTDSQKDVRLVAFDLRASGLRYQAGDSLGVYPENCPELVEAILEVLGATSDEPVVLSSGRSARAHDALLRECTIAQSDERLAALLAQTVAASEAKELRMLAEDGDRLEGLDLLDLLERFPSARRVPIADLVAALPPLQPRLYSISSSPVAHPEEVHLTVGVVRYNRAGCARQRKGVASTFLAERVQPGRKVRIFIQPSHGFKLPAQDDVPIIMVGPGTGIAPFRAFLQERAARGAGGSWLFFGDQRRTCDFLYREELADYQRSGTLTYLDTAFSRDQPQKVYVQDRMYARAETLWSWLEKGAHFYVCGDARRMARDVDAMLKRIVMEQGRRSEAEARAYIVEMSKAKRYQCDVY